MPRKLTLKTWGFLDLNTGIWPVDDGPIDLIMNTKQHLRPGEQTFAVALVLLSGLVFSEAYSISGFKGLTTGGVMPTLASGVMVVSSLAILTGTFSRSRSTETQRIIDYLFPLRVVLFALVVALYAVAIPYLGFILASGGFLFVTILGLWRRGALWSLTISVVSMVAIYFLFRIVFQVVLPVGSLWR